MAEEIIKSISLYSDAGGSDKVYNVFMVKTEDGYLVKAENGPRLGRIVPAKSIPCPDEAKAQKKYDSLIKEKMTGSSRYRENPYAEKSENAAPAYATAMIDKVPSGAATMMLSEVVDDAHRERLLDDPSYVVEEKFYGVYTKAIVKDGEVTGSNKKGFVIGLPESIKKMLAAPGKSFVVDFELVGEHLYLFECPSINGGVPRAKYEDRKAALEELDIECDKIHIVRSSGTDRASKEALIEMVRERRGEGVVFKHLHAPYEDGISKYVLKDKFTASATVVVLEHSVGVRSVTYGATDAAGAMVRQGNVAIPLNMPVPGIGAIIEIEYLHANPGTHALQEPVYMGERVDQDLSDCKLSQLKYKGELDHEAINAPAPAKRRSAVPA